VIGAANAAAARGAGLQRGAAADAASTAGRQHAARHAGFWSIALALRATSWTAWVAAAPAHAGSGTAVRLDVPVVRQSPERCGPAALRMVLAFYGADAAALAAADSAYDPTLRGSLVTDLADRARRVGFPARITTGGRDSLIAWLERGTPPIVLYARGIGPVSRAHYGVIVGWDPAGRFVLHDGSSRPHTVSAHALERRRAPLDRRVLLVGPKDLAP